MTGLHWTAGPLLVALLAASVLYLRRWRRARAAGGPDGRRRWLGLWMAGMLLLAVTLMGPLDRLAETRLMSAHMLEHVLLLSAVPALLLPALGGQVRGLAARRPGLSRAAVAAGCLVVVVVAFWVLHAPPVLEAGIRTPALGDLQHLVLLGAGLLLSWPLLGPDRVTGMPAVAFVVAAEVGIGVVGVFLAWYPEVIYPFYETAPRTLGLSAQDDQAAAGALLLVVEEPFLAVEFAVVFIGGVLSQTGDE